MLEKFILGSIQGIAEWLPVSSEGILVLIKTNFFNEGQQLDALIKGALFLHIGTLFAALVYFWKDVRKLIVAMFQYKTADNETKQILRFLIIATSASGICGWLLLNIVIGFGRQVTLGSRLITLIIGLLLFMTGMLQIRTRQAGYKDSSHLKIGDSILLGIVQGFAVLPGLSRSGLTVSAFLLRKYEKTFALRLSFLMSLPVVFWGNVLLNRGLFTFQPAAMVGILSSFLFGILTIHLLLKVSRKINFGYFVLIFAVLMLVSAI